MAPPSEVRTTFTIDLNPFAAGLKTMLAMTQAAGKQITPLLNMQVKTPNYGVFDEQLKGLTKTVDDYIAAQVESAKVATTQTGAMGDLGGKTDDLEKKTRKSSAATEGHATSLRHMKRESIEVFGGISFLVQSIMQLASSSGLGDQKLQKMSQSMAQGISAGFGLASMMMLLNLASGGTAAIIGAVVTVGITLLNFFASAETRAKIATAAMESFNQSLRGASSKDLRNYRQALLDNINALSKTIAALEQSRKAAALTYGGIMGYTEGLDALLGTTMTGYGKINKVLNDYIELRRQAIERVQKIDAQETSSEMTQAEMRNRVRDLQIQSITTTYEQRRQQALQDAAKAFEENDKMLKGSKEWLDANVLVQKVYENKIKQVHDDELKEKEEHRKRMLDMDKEMALSSIDMDEKKALSTAKTELDRIAITETFALKRLAVEQEFSKQSLLIEKARLEKLGGPDQKRRIAEIDDELAKLAARGQVMQQKILSESSSQVMAIPGMPPVGTIARQLQIIKHLEDEFNEETNAGRRQAIQQLIALENHKLDAMTMSGQELLRKERETQEQRRQAWAETHGFEMSLINGLTSGVRSMFGELLMVHRQAANSWDAVWISMQNTVISALSEMAAKALENWIIDKVLMAGTVATTTAAMEIITAAASAAATLVSIATFGGAAAIGTGAVLAGLGTVKVASMAGFEKGGKSKRGEAGFIEGFKPEIIAPEEDFYKIARTEMIPRMLIEQDRQLNVRLAKSVAETAKSNVSGFDRELMTRFEDAITRLENIEWKARGDQLIAVTREAKVKGKRSGLRYDSAD